MDEDQERGSRVLDLDERSGARRDETARQPAIPPAMGADGGRGTDASNISVDIRISAKTPNAATLVEELRTRVGR